MSVIAITIIEPAIGPITRGLLSQLWRVGATMAGVRAGDLLWVREPFHLSKSVGHLSPSAAHAKGQKPFFAVDLTPDTPAAPDWLGKRQMARTMLRVWHRQHLVVTAVEHRHLHTITEWEAKAQGFACIDHFARGWDKNLMFETRHDVRWATNPKVTLLSFDRIEGPVPTLPAKKEAAHA